MTRREILRNALLGIAMSLVPKILQPTSPDIFDMEGSTLYNVKDYTMYEYTPSGWVKYKMPNIFY